MKVDCRIQLLQSRQFYFNKLPQVGSPRVYDNSQYNKIDDA